MLVIMISQSLTIITFSITDQYWKALYSGQCTATATMVAPLDFAHPKHTSYLCLEPVT